MSVSGGQLNDDDHCQCLTAQEDENYARAETASRALWRESLYA